MLTFSDFTALLIIYMCIVNMCSSLDCYQCEGGTCKDAKDLGKLKTCQNQPGQPEYVCSETKVRDKLVSNFRYQNFYQLQYKLSDAYASASAGLQINSFSVNNITENPRTFLVF